MGESDLTRDQRRGNKSGVRLVKCCCLETKLNNIILSLDADITTKLKSMFISVRHLKLIHNTMIGSTILH